MGFLLRKSTCKIFHTMRLSKMAGSSVPQIPDVDIDSAGVFKYILIKLKSSQKDVQEYNKLIVRGYGSCSFHGDIFDEVMEKLQKQVKGLKASCLGGGRINHDPESKKIHVYGYSQGYGKADHSISVELIKKHYQDYKVTWSDEGY